MRVRLGAVTASTACLAWLGCSVITTACGGAVGRGSDDGGSEASGTNDANADDPSVSSQCESPSGFAVCGGPSKCPNGPACKCATSYCDGGAGLCFNDAALATPAPICFLCPDGQVCAVEMSLCGKLSTDLGDCYPFEVGALLAQNGAADQVHYADDSLWTGDPLPTPTTCPTFGTFRICGGNCGGCNSGEVCTGRSPLHPYGMCVATSAPVCSAQGTTPCDVGSSCFRYTVQPAAQPGADRYGVCLPTAECQDLAANLPGGGTCE